MTKSNYFSESARNERRNKRIASLDVKAAIGVKEVSIPTQETGLRAIAMASQVLSNYVLPNKPSLRYSGVHKAKTAKKGGITDGVVTVNASFRTPSGVTTAFDMPIEIRAGEILEPSVVVFNGVPKIIAQSTFDHMSDIGTFYQNSQDRSIYGSPLTNDQAKHTSRIKSKRINKGLFSSPSNRLAVKDAIAGKHAQLQDESMGPDQQMSEIPDMTDEAELLNPAWEQNDIVSELYDLKSQGASREQAINSVIQQGALGDDHPNEMQLGYLADMWDRIASKHVAKIVHQNGEWLVKTKDGKKTLGRHKSKADARKQLSAIEINKHKRGQYREEGDEYVEDANRNSTGDLDCIDPAEVKDENDLHAGEEVTLKEDLDVKDRGGGTYEFNKGEKVMIIRDHAGDNKSFVVEFKNGAQAIVERHFLKKAQRELNPGSKHDRSIIKEIMTRNRRNTPPVEPAKDNLGGCSDLELAMMDPNTKMEYWRPRDVEYNLKQKRDTSVGLSEHAEELAQEELERHLNEDDGFDLESSKNAQLFNAPKQQKTVKPPESLKTTKAPKSLSKSKLDKQKLDTKSKKPCQKCLTGNCAYHQKKQHNPFK